MVDEVENYLADQLLKAVGGENFDSAKNLIEKHNANPYFVVHEHGIAPIHLAVCMKNERAAEYFTKYFLQVKGDPNVLTGDRETPLHIACYYGRLEIVELLMSEGGDVSIKDADGKSALAITIELEQFDVFDLLKKILHDPGQRIGVDVGHMFTPNNKNYDVVSPKHQTAVNRKNTMESPDVQQQQVNIFELNEPNLKQFEKQKKSVSRRSLVNTRKDQLLNTDVEIVFDENFNKFSDNATASSTKLINEIDVDQLMDTCHTANDDQTKPSETSFIQTPNHKANGAELLQIVEDSVEDYRHIGRENGLEFFESKMEPCGSQSSKQISPSSKASMKYTVPSECNTADLRRELTKFGDSPDVHEDLPAQLSDEMEERLQISSESPQPSGTHVQTISDGGKDEKEQSKEQSSQPESSTDESQIILKTTTIYRHYPKRQRRPCKAYDDLKIPKVGATEKISRSTADKTNVHRDRKQKISDADDWQSTQPVTDESQMSSKTNGMSENDVGSKDLELGAVENESSATVTKVVQRGPKRRIETSTSAVQSNIDDSQMTSEIPAQSDNDKHIATPGRNTKTKVDDGRNIKTTVAENLEVPASSTDESQIIFKTTTIYRYYPKRQRRPCKA